MSYRIERVSFFGPNSPQYLSMTQNGEELGTLEYSTRDRARSINLDGVHVRQPYRRQGIGAQLVKAFTRKVGPGRVVYGGFIHEETKRILLDKYASQVRESGEGISVPREEFQKLPVVQLLKMGGVRVKRVTITHHQLDDPEMEYSDLSINFTART